MAGINPLELNNIQKLRTTLNRANMYYTPVDLIQKAKDDQALIKGGEGSRGGKVIGHTKSGKPIYDVHPSETNHVSGREGFHSDFQKKHSHFTAEDHKDAVDAHNKEHEKAGDDWDKHHNSVSADEWNDSKNEKGHAAYQGAKHAAAEQDKHGKLARWHKVAAKEKENK